MYFPSKYLIAAIIIHGCVGLFEDLVQLIFIKAPVPLGNFYNESLSLHYGISLNDDGLSQVMSVISSLQIFGSMISLLIILPKMDSFGRRSVAIYFRAGLAFVATVLMLFGKFLISVELFVVGYAILGATTPIRFGVTKYYISECAPDNIRGFITQMLTAVGGIICVAFSTLLMPQFLGNDENWHYTLYIAIVIIFIFVLGAVFIPESPKFLWFQGKKTQSIEAVKAFHGKDVDIVHVTHNYDLERLLTHSKSAMHTSIKEIWGDLVLRNSLILVFAAAFVATLGPLHIYALYSIILKIKFGFTNSQAVTFELFLNLSCLPLGYLLPFLYEKIGRRPLFLLSVGLSLIAAIFMCLAEAVFELNNSTSSWLTFVFAILFTVAINLSIMTGVSTFGILLIADLLPAPAKAATTQAMMLTTSILGIIFNFLFSFFQPLLGFSLYLPIIGCQLFFFVYLFRNLPETKQKSVHQNFEEFEVQSRKSSALSQPFSKDSVFSYGAISQKPSIKPKASIMYAYGYDVV